MCFFFSMTIHGLMNVCNTSASLFCLRMCPIFAPLPSPWNSHSLTPAIKCNWRWLKGNNVERVCAINMSLMMKEKKRRKKE